MINVNKSLHERLKSIIELYKDPEKKLIKAVNCYNNPYYVRLLESIIRLEDDRKILKLAIEYEIRYFRDEKIVPQPIDMKKYPNMTVKEWFTKCINDYTKIEELSWIKGDVLGDIVDPWGHADWDEVPIDLQDKIEKKCSILKDNIIKNRNKIKSKLIEYMNSYSNYFNALLKDVFDVEPGDYVRL